jgi:hypothetical protein
MRVRDHLVLSVAGAALLRPWAGGSALGLVAGGVLIDADHYAWFCLSQRSLNPVAAVRFFNEAGPPQHAATRALHSPIVLLGVLLAGLHQRRLLPLALGMGLHVVLDAHHRARMDEARAAALFRDRFSCQACGSQATPVDTHIRRQPWLMPSYATKNLISLCRPCHEAAHLNARGARWWA